MNYALWADRVLAALIDGGIVLAMTLVLYGLMLILGIASILAADASRAGENSPLGALPCCFCCGAPFGVALISLLFGLYNKVYLVSKRGCSIGQKFRNLRVVMANGSPVPLGTLIVRLLIQFGFGLFWPVQVLNLLFPLWDEKRQTLHDKAVGTVVIKID